MAEQLLARQRGRLDERLPLGGQDGISRPHLDEAEQGGGVDERQQFPGLEVQVAREAMEIGSTALLGHQLEETCQGPHPRVRQRREGTPPPDPWGTAARAASRFVRS